MVGSFSCYSLVLDTLKFVDWMQNLSNIVGQNVCGVKEDWKRNNCNKVRSKGIQVEVIYRLVRRNIVNHIHLFIQLHLKIPFRFKIRKHWKYQRPLSFMSKFTYFFSTKYNCRNLISITFYRLCQVFFFLRICFLLCPTVDLVSVDLSAFCKFLSTTILLLSKIS